VTLRSPWQIIDSGPLSVLEVMQKDEFLLQQLSPRSSILHFYEWKTPSLTYGYFIQPEQHLAIDKLHENGFQIARRPTGGGIIFHIADFAFSLLIPECHPSLSLKPLDNYRWINQHVAEVIQQVDPLCPTPSLLPFKNPIQKESFLPFCMAKPTPYDILIEEKKVGGAAQRRTRKGLLHQASISLFLPSLPLLSTLIKDSRIIEAMHMQGYYLLGEKPSLEAIKDYQILLRQKLIQYLTCL
jgi:lipoate-protein ligase A